MAGYRRREKMSLLQGRGRLLTRELSAKSKIGIVAFAQSLMEWDSPRRWAGTQNVSLIAAGSAVASVALVDANSRHFSIDISRGGMAEAVGVIRIEWEGGAKMHTFNNRSQREEEDRNLKFEISIISTIGPALMRRLGELFASSLDHTDFFHQPILRAQERKL
ncbi:hypothetical protein ARMGADRAFT_1034105 [Armillaria gallica]|uniref:Uncharacterized protein n=1 Tax=Armillaria gallica TaxID=47427 RepID=A0A2H3CYS6_ARMGA|nr:hypothetical protein ARMGADRAFT_1034105 [Armillaria gallica]